MSMIQENIRKIHNNISLICDRLQRDPSHIIVVGVTKYSSVQDIQISVNNGLCHIGESKVQQALEKYHSLETSRGKVTKHMIGHLQTNKVKQAVEVFDVIQSVDSLRLALEIEKQCVRLGRSMDILVQVNTSAENQKFGIAPCETLELLKKISDLPHLRVRGLMTIALWSEKEKLIRDCFKRLKNLRDQVHEQFRGNSSIQMDFLSMGMTDDYPIAIEEGSNMVRIGRAIFSPKP